MTLYVITEQNRADFMPCKGPGTPVSVVPGGANRVKLPWFHAVGYPPQNFLIRHKLVKSYWIMTYCRTLFFYSNIALLTSTLE